MSIQPYLPFTYEELDMFEPDNDYDDCEDEPQEYCFTCQNLGTVLCECGGDLCVCLNNGEMPCPDCEL